MIEGARQVKGIWIPIEIWEDQSLSWNEKVLLMEIDSYTRQDLDCFFSNECIAELLGVSANWASQLVSSLTEKGYIIKSRSDGRKRFLQSALRYSIEGRLIVNSKADFDKTQRQTLIKLKGRLIVNSKHNNIDNNISNKKEINKAARFDFKSELIALGVSEEAADAWMQVRKTKRATNTKIAFDRIASEISKSGKTADECVRIAVERSWQGFQAEWVVRDAQRVINAPQRKLSAYEQNLKTADELFGTNLHEQQYGK